MPYQTIDQINAIQVSKNCLFTAYNGSESVVITLRGMGLIKHTNNWLSNSESSSTAASSPTRKVRSTPMLAFTCTPVDFVASPQTPALSTTALSSAVTSGSLSLKAASKAGRPMTSNVRANTGCEKAETVALASAVSLKGICSKIGSQPENWLLFESIRSALMMALLSNYLYSSEGYGKDWERKSHTFARTP